MLTSASHEHDCAARARSGGYMHNYELILLEHGRTEKFVLKCTGGVGWNTST